MVFLFPNFLTFIFINFLCFTSSVYATSNPELESLLKLKSSLDPSNTYLSSWSNNGNPRNGTFEGVGCNEYGQVANISLQGKGLNGQLSPAISKFKYLTRIWSAGCDPQATIRRGWEASLELQSDWDTTSGQQTRPSAGSSSATLRPSHQPNHQWGSILFISSIIKPHLHKSSIGHHLHHLHQTSSASQGNYRRRRNYRSEDDDDANGHDGGKDSSSADERCTELNRPKRWRG